MALRRPRATASPRRQVRTALCPSPSSAARSRAAAARTSRGAPGTHKAHGTRSATQRSARSALSCSGPESGAGTATLATASLVYFSGQKRSKNESSSHSQPSSRS
ncbi:hypothetical protein GN956_G23361 [Arapaima gigas]